MNNAVFQTNASRPNRSAACRVSRTSAGRDPRSLGGSRPILCPAVRRPVPQIRDSIQWVVAERDCPCSYSLRCVVGPASGFAYNSSYPWGLWMCKRDLNLIYQRKKCANVSVVIKGCTRNKLFYIKKKSQSDCIIPSQNSRNGSYTRPITVSQDLLRSQNYIT